MEQYQLNETDVEKLNTKKGLRVLLSEEPYNLSKAIRFLDYEKKLKKLQVELVKLQTWAIQNNERIIIIFEGRDAAGKGGAIRRITERINQVKVANSGVTKKENYVLEELETKIDVLIKEAGRYYYACDKNTTILRRFSKCTFLAYRNSKIGKNDTGFSDIEVKSFLKDYDHRFKKPLKTLLHEYYRIKLNPDIQLEGSLLEQLNFKPCSHCNGSYGKSWNIKNTVLVDVL